MSASNIVPFATTPPAPTPPPWPPGYWPMPSGVMPGCAPPSGGLMDCYWSVQQATAFISAIMIDAINNNPAVTQAIIAAIEASGSTLPLLGVTNGAEAQPGQVGELVWLTATVNYTAAFQNQTITLGIIQPGDWDFWIYAICPNPVMGVNFVLTPSPAGLYGTAQGFFITAVAGGASQVVCVSPVCRLLSSVPTLLPVEVLTNQNAAGPAAGTLSLELMARRRR